MTKDEHERISDRILVLDIKIESEHPHRIPDTMLGTAKETFNLLDSGLMKFKKIINERHKEISFANAAKELSKLEDFFTLITRT